MKEEGEAAQRTIGICVSGGGLRAASFATGALQALDDRLGLLRGEGCADYLSAVSGGSYIAGAFTLVNAGTRIRTTDNREINGVTDLPDGHRPFAPGSAEADHLGKHCSYLIEDGGVRTSLRLIGLIFAGIVTSFALMAWVGTMVIADLTLIGLQSAGLPPQRYSWMQWLIAIVFIGSLVVLVAFSRRISKLLQGIRSRVVRSAVALPLMFVVGVVVTACAPSFVSRLRSLEPISTPSWWFEHAGAVAVVVGAIAGLIALSVVLRRTKLAVALLLLVLSLGLRLAILLTTVWIGLYVLDQMQEQDWMGFALFGGVLMVGVLIIPVPGRVSPHRPYRDMLSRCFVITRGNPLTIPSRPERIALSSLRPPDRGRPDSFPQLIVCAAANVSDVGASPAGTNVVPLLITPKQICVPDVPGAAIPIERLEEQTRPAGLFSVAKREPLMSLPTAVAITGAAVSPAMGRMTNSRLRQLITMLNLRLGVWLPNPMNEKTRENLGKFKFASGLDMFLLELVGAHSSKSPTIFASDGGHYENLGLVELVRLRCSTIWCIDSSGGPGGSAGGLAQSLLLSEAATGARIELDMDRFAAAPASTRTRSRVKEVFAIGRIYYSDRPPGQIIVIKLGLTERSPSALREYQKTDNAFPHHSTLNQIYRAERFIAYRRLGWDSTMQAIEAATRCGIGRSRTPTDTVTEMPLHPAAEGA
jgi:Lysophospholipase catalytic domain